MKIGPGLLVTAAFIGPGTVITASKAGAGFGFQLVWVVVFSVIATIVFQEMSARLGIVSKSGLGEAIRNTFANPVLKWSAIGLVISAVLIGNIAYEGGNINGGVTGSKGLMGEDDQLENDPNAKSTAEVIATVAISVLALAILMMGRYKLIQNLLIPVVCLMSLFFLLGAIVSNPDWAAVSAGFIPRFPEGSFLTVAGLIGTTVVPYNLFLHASGAAKQWSEDGDKQVAIRQSRLDSVLAIGLGGMVTAAILITASQCFHESATELDGENISRQIEPVLGAWAQTFFACGLLAAGLTSAITAPLAAALATSGCLGRTTDPGDKINRCIMTMVVLIGMTVALIGAKPVSVIFFAQVANAFILPFIAIFLIIAMNRQSIVGDFRNRLLSNVLGAVVVIFVISLGGYQIWKIANSLIQ